MNTVKAEDMGTSRAVMWLRLCTSKAVQSLVRELRSHMLGGMAKRKKNLIKKNNKVPVLKRKRKQKLRRRHFCKVWLVSVVNLYLLTMKGLYCPQKELCRRVAAVEGQREKWSTLIRSLLRHTDLVSYSLKLFPKHRSLTHPRKFMQKK